MWFITGAAIIIFAVIIRNKINEKNLSLSWPTWAGMILTAFFVLFAFTWSVSSIIEGENQAAGMGLVFFGGASLIGFALTRRSLIKDTSESAE